MTGKPDNSTDWSTEWTRAYAKSSIIMRRANSPSYWDKRANRFSTMDNGASGRIQAVLDHIGLDSETTLLDIGCGPGNLAVPLAKSARQVTALDPSEGMLKKLEQRAEKEGVTNIQPLNKGWEEAVVDGDIIPHDVVLSSYSLIMKDVGKALAAMNAAASRTVCLFWFAGRECFGYDRFWPALFGEEYVAGPDYALLLNLLHSMDIRPEVSIIPQQHVTTYADMDDAVQCWTENLYVSSQEEQDIIRIILSNTLDTHTGKPVLTRNVQTAMLWWHKQ
nr:class I SAM-dependent methyltransferase [uncultured Pseudodesulfovibrio sp.]